MIEKTLVLLKPEAVQRCLVGEILSRFEKAGIKIVGGTEPSTAPPGTIRGDYAHHTFGYADKKDIAIKNLIHASGSKKSQSQQSCGAFFTPKNGHSTTAAEQRGINPFVGNKEDAKYELNLWFTEEELHDYTTVHDLHVL